MKKRIKKKIHKYVKQYIAENNMVRLSDINRPIVTIHNPSLKISSRIETTDNYTLPFEYYTEKIIDGITSNVDFKRSVRFIKDINPINGNKIIIGTIEIYNPNTL